MPLLLCYVLLTVPTSTSRLLSGTASVEQAALSSLVPFMCCFCTVRVLKAVLIGLVHKSRRVLHQFSHSSVKRIVMRKSHCNSLCLCSLWKFLLLVLG